MWRNYFKLALRNLRRHKGYAFLNIAGLALGIACCLLILLAVRHELSYDRFHPGAAHLYRVVQDVSWGEGDAWAWTAARMGPALAEDVAEVEAVARIHLEDDILVSYEGAGHPARFHEDGFAFADPSFFEMFAFPFVQGDTVTALDDPLSIVLTASMAEKYFGDENPVGKTLRIDDRGEATVTGVLKDPPENSHLDFNFVVPFETLHRWYDMPEFTSWWFPQVQTYVRLSEDADVAALNEERLPTFIKAYREGQYSSTIVPRFQPLTGIHLYGNPGGNAIRFVYIFSVIGVFLLLIACINYMNLATARAAHRAREVGVRKVAGAHRGQLVAQFFGESLLITGVALLAGVLLAELLLPGFNRLVGLPLSLNLTADGLWLGLAGIAVVVGLLAGSYPALFLSKFAPAEVLKGISGQAAGGERLRKGLVVLQFTLSTALIVGTLVVYHQVDYMRSKPLGFDQEQVVALPMHGDEDVQQGYTSFKYELEQMPGVESVSAANWLPGISGSSNMAFQIEGINEEIERDPNLIYVDHGFFETLGIDIAEGRGFSEQFSSDVENAFLLTPTALRSLGLEAPLGKQVRFSYSEFGRTLYEKEGQIVGVTEEFHLSDLRSDIYPAALTLAEDPASQLSQILVRLAPGSTQATLDRIERRWNEHFPFRPLEVTFIDEQVDALYRQEARFGRAVGAFAGLAILIACLGLFGLAAFSAQQRTKEIGIRKVLGASTTSIVALLSKEFAGLIVLAFVLAAPIAYYVMHRWLEHFAYRVELSPTAFLLAGLAALAVALLTVSFQAVRAALADPVESLRYE